MGAAQSQASRSRVGSIAHPAQRVTKQQFMIDMPSRPEGPTIEELAEATG